MLQHPFHIDADCPWDAVDANPAPDISSSLVAWLLLHLSWWSLLHLWPVPSAASQWTHRCLDGHVYTFCLTCGAILPLRWWFLGRHGQSDFNSELKKSLDSCLRHIVLKTHDCSGVVIIVLQASSTRWLGTRGRMAARRTSWWKLSLSRNSVVTPLSSKHAAWSGRNIPGWLCLERSLSRHSWLQFQSQSFRIQESAQTGDRSLLTLRWRRTACKLL